MFVRVRERALLLAGVSVVMLGGAPSAALAQVRWGTNTVHWGPPAVRVHPPIFIPERPWTERKPKYRSVRPAESRRPAARRTVTTPTRESVRTEVTVLHVKPPRPAEPVEIKTQPPKTTPPAQATKTAKLSDKPDKAPAATPAGPLHVIVSVDEQRASLYANGEFVASTKVSTGTKSHPTPMGVFSVIQKNRHHISNLYGVPMPYMQRLTWSGTAMHTGHLPGYPASHGCIRLTDDFAQLLWKATKIGARVIVTRGDVKPVEIAHARLLTPRTPEQASAAAPAEITGALVRTADARSTMGAAPDSASPSASKLDIVAPAPIINDRNLSRDTRSAGPVSIFISRKDARLYVRQAMAPLFDLPLTVRDPSQPIGTHVYTAMEMKDGAMRWTAVSIPSSFASQAPAVAKGGTKKSSRAETTGMAPARQVHVPGASAALDRVDIPQDALDRLAAMITPGSSLIVSDNGISHETGRSTDFIVLTR
jgi:lipoprotein-anchoring transpeptidase ErfK/SrfK